MKKQKSNEVADVKDSFERECIKSPGSHCCIIGTTGSGKTQTLYLIVEGEVNRSHETIVWIDRGKNDFLTLMEFSKIRLIIPMGMRVVIEPSPEFAGRIKDEEIERVYFPIDKPEKVWDYIKKGYINIVCVCPFILEPSVFAFVIAKMVQELIRKSHREDIITPMTVVMDEFQDFCPSQNNTVGGKDHSVAASWMVYNLEKLRAMGVRVLATVHQWTEIKRAGRKNFGWKIARRGTYFERDEPRLHQYMDDIARGLSTERARYINPASEYSDAFEMPLYRKGADYGKVRYIGEMTEEDVKHPDKYKELRSDTNGQREAFKGDTEDIRSVPTAGSGERASAGGAVHGDEVQQGTAGLIQ